MRRSGRDAIPILGRVFGLVGVGLWLAAVAVATPRIVFLRSAHEAEGTVMGSVRRGGSWVPDVQFYAEGRPYRFLGSVGSRPPAYRTGEPVVVAYDPGNPSDALIEAHWQLWLLPTIFALVGAPFAILGVVLGFVARRRPTAPT